MRILIEILKNYPLMAALLSMFTGQAFKIIYYYVIDKKLDMGHFFESGGMPSAHSAMATALVTAVGISQGFSSAPFAVSFAFACIVMYDAVGVRRATGYQSMILNRITEDLYKSGKMSKEKLHEFMGHSPVEVFFGILLGIAIAVALYLGVYRVVA